MATIITKNSSTASSVPLAAQLVQGELAVNVTDKRLFTENSGGTVVELGTNPSSLSTGALAYTGTMTGGTGVVNLGSGQVYKDASGNLGIGTSSPAKKFAVSDGGGIGLEVSPNESSNGRNRIISFNRSTTAYVPLLIEGEQVLFGAGTGSGAPERMRIDSSGNLLVGTTTPLVNAGGRGNITINGSTDAVLAFGIGGATSAYIFNNASALVINAQPSRAITFETGNTERARIDSSGNLLVGYTAKGGTAVNSLVAANAYNCKAGAGASLGGNVFNINWTGTPQLWIDTTNVGTITTTSDYRVKQNVEPQIAPALERVMQLRPVTYELKDYGTLYKADGVAREGFIAHELQAVIPSAVEGEKDAEDQIQSLKLDALCSVLTKAIQEQQTTIVSLQDTLTALTARITALEST